MIKPDVIMKSETTFHWLDSNRIRLAIRQETKEPEVIMKSKTSFHWLDSYRIRLEIHQETKKLEVIMKSKNHISFARFQSN
jgi:hypothetical protein